MVRAIAIVNVILSTANHGSDTKWSMEEVRTDVGKLGEKKSRVIRTGHEDKATLTRAN